MEQITVTNVDLTSVTFGVGDYAFAIVTKGSQRHEYMGADTLELTVNTSVLLPVYVGAIIIYKDRPYTLNRYPGIKVIGQSEFEYTFQFEGMNAFLTRVVFFNYLRNEIEFSHTGNFESFIEIIESNYGRGGDPRVMLEFDTSDVPATEVNTITFSNDNCTTALQKICDAFRVRYISAPYVDESDQPYIRYIFQYSATRYMYSEWGRIGLTLTELAIGSEGERKFCTVLYPFGSDRNIPSNYRDYSKRLKPTGDEYIQSDDMLDTYGRYEAAEVVDSIFPHRVGTITSIPTDETFSTQLIVYSAGTDRVYLPEGTDPFLFKVGDVLTDNALIPSGAKIVYVQNNSSPYYLIIDQLTLGAGINPTTITRGLTDYYSFCDSGMFDLNETDENGHVYLCQELAPKITFNTGYLAGYSFAVHSYNHSTHRFTVVPITDERDLTIPNENGFYFQVGDEYVLTDIKLPDSYVEDAEDALQDYASETLYPVLSSFNHVADATINEFYYKKQFEDDNLTWYDTDDPGYPHPTTHAREDNDIFTPGYLYRVYIVGLVGYFDLLITGIERDVMREWSYKLSLGSNKYTDLQLEILKMTQNTANSFYQNPANRREQVTVAQYNQK